MLAFITGRFTAIAAAIAAIAMLATFGAYALTKSQLRDSRAKTYQALLLERAERIDQWLGERLDDAHYIGADPEIVKLAQKALKSGDRVCVDAAVYSAKLADILNQHFREDAPLSAHIASTDGRILVSLSGLCGKRLSSFVRDQLPDAKHTRPSIINPLTEAERIEGAAPEKQRRMIWFETEIRSPAGQRLAYIGYGLDAEQHFDKTLLRAATGFPSNLFAFDRHGIILNKGKNLKDSQLVKEALAAIAKSDLPGDGTLMEPFTGRLDLPAVGAWRWLETGNIGLGLEVSARDTYQPVNVLQWMAALLGCLAVALGALAIWLLRSETAPGGGLRRIGPYKIISPLGEGAVSDVYLAEHILMRRKVALKLLKPQFTTDEWSERFKREVRLSAQLHHPNFVRIYDFGHMSGGHFYYAMEHVDGVNFAELVESDGPLGEHLVVQMLKQVCEGLVEAHGKGILHRDIKPQNLMFRQAPFEDLQVKILDFGLVKAIDNDHSRDLTHGLRILGTPAYLAPERILSPACADPRSDLYSVGAVGFFLLTGRKVFESESDLQLTHRILHEQAPRVSDFYPEGVTPELDDLISSCLAKEPDKRPHSAQELADRLALLEVKLESDMKDQKQLNADQI